MNIVNWQVKVENLCEIYHCGQVSRWTVRYEKMGWIGNKYGKSNNIHDNPKLLKTKGEIKNE